MITFRADPELERIRAMMLELAGGDEALLNASIGRVFSRRGEVVLSELIEDVCQTVPEPRRALIQRAKRALCSSVC